MEYEHYVKNMWLSIYGSYISLLCHQHILDKKGPILKEDMNRFKEKAKEIADLHEKSL